MTVGGDRCEQRSSRGVRCASVHVASRTVSPRISTANVTARKSDGNVLALVHANAHFSDGSQRDVTGEAAWTSENHSVVTVSPAGLARGNERGETDISAAYSQAVNTRRVFVLPPRDIQAVGQGARRECRRDGCWCRGGQRIRNGTLGSHTTGRLSWSSSPHRDSCSSWGRSGALASRSRGPFRRHAPA